MEYIFEGLGAGFAVFYTVYMAVVSAIGIATYVLRSLGMYTIAKRRGINNPWMSWIPVLDMWLLGCVSDQFQYVVKGKDKNKRKWLLGLNIALVAAYIVFFVFCGVTIASAVMGTTGGIDEDHLIGALMGPATGMVLCMLPLTAIAIAAMVIRYVAMYDLYTSCSPQNNVLFLVLSIFFNITEPFFVFFSRKKDDGMPPRRQQPEYIPPQYGESL